MAVEGAVIVLSILMAFSIDALWEGRGERQQERAILTSLEAEFSAALAVVESVVASHEAREASALGLLQLSKTPGADLPSSVEGQLAAAFLNQRTLNVPTGAVDSYLASGNPELIRNTRLRVLLASWSGLLEENLEDEVREQRLIEGELRPFLMSRTAVGRLYAAYGNGQIYGEFPDAGMDTAGLSTILADPAFQNLVTVRVAGVRVLQREVGVLLTSATEILGLVRAELAS